MKNIFLVVLFLMLSFINIMPTHSLDSIVEKIDAIYKIYHTNGSMSYSRNSSYKLYVDGKFTYCITPGIFFVKGDGY